jgi:cytoskeletal protein RodZ
VQSHYLKAIEEGNFSALPGHSYTRAIIRSYAQCLGVSPVPILLYYEKRSQGSAAETLSPSNRPLPSRKERYAARKDRSGDWKSVILQRLSSKKLFVGLMAILLLGLLSTFYFFDFFGSEPEAASVQPSQGPVEGASSKAESSSQSVSPPKEEADEVTVRLVKTSESNEHGDEYAIGNADQVIVTIKATAKSWFRARGGGPTRPVMKDGYIQAGQTETFTHSEWISLHLGRPDKIEVHVNGYLVDTEGQKDPQTYQFRLEKKTKETTKKNS